MRIKRQRRKLRGKYSGNCLSCAAKWSKCWYIASVDNQHEWQTRLNKVVTPCEDEVCFQCWDAKIRTSPKRKIHFKSELPPIPLTNAENIASLNGPRPSRRLERNKRRALNNDFDYNVDAVANATHTTSTTKKSIPHNEFVKSEEEDTSFDDDYDEEIFVDEASEDSEIIELEERILFEEDAVILLSTAFKTIPFHIEDMNVNMNININITGNSRINCPEIAKQIINDEAYDEEMKAKKRGAYPERRNIYYCGKCGKLKKGHVCASSSPITTPAASPSLSPAVSVLNPMVAPLEVEI